LEDIGKALAQIKAAKPTLDCDSRFSVKEWTGNDFAVREPREQSYAA
jgi:hypothetical protein